ncbi:MAG: hypothetical protein ACYTG6_09190 [Planctomycetota bacterium]|jgi:hypothetical protein
MAENKVFEFDVPEGRTADDVMAEAKDKAREVGIAIVGDGTSGRFEGTATGSYRTEGRTLRVEVESKPAFVPWRIIESGLNKLFG